MQVDCQELVYTDRTKLLLDFADYLSDPDKVERRILEREACNRKFTLGDAVEAGPPPGYKPASCSLRAKAPPPVKRLNRPRISPVRAEK